MNSNQLECFIRVAESLSFARASEELNLSQPTVSRQIHTLEEELGVQLFQRTTRNVTLTSQGTSFLIDARDILNRMKLASANLRQDTAARVPVLYMGCCLGSDLDFFSNLLYRCRQEIPGLHPYLRIVPHKHILGLFMANQFDVILGFQEESYKKLDITYLHLFHVDICCVVSDRHPFARQDTIRLETLCSEPLIACNSPDLPGEMVQIQKQMESRIGLPDIYYCEDISVALSMVRAGYGFALLPDMQSNLYADVKCIPVEEVTPLSYGIYYMKSGMQNPVLKSFILMLKYNR